ncbi:MAG: hypothetical protein P1U41_10380 [Vicingaceae bacterium]|nr:hypothetical protein [Vicingaceae bacterium]
MFREIMIKESAPRDLTTFNESFSKGLRLKQFFGYFFLVAAIMLILISVLILKMAAPAIIFLLVAGMGYYMISKINKKIKLRKEVFNKGSVVKAKVESHERKFNPFKSNKDFMIRIKPVTNDNSTTYTIINTSENLWAVSPIGAEIIGLYFDGDYFFGEEISCQFTML